MVTATKLRCVPRILPSPCQHREPSLPLKRRLHSPLWHDLLIVPAAQVEPCCPITPLACFQIPAPVVLRAQTDWAPLPAACHPMYAPHPSQRTTRNAVHAAKGRRNVLTHTSDAQVGAAGVLKRKRRPGRLLSKAPLFAALLSLSLMTPAHTGDSYPLFAVSTLIALFRACRGDMVGVCWWYRGHRV